MSTADDAYAALVTAWADELRAGSSRTWAAFRSTGTPARTPAAYVPAAANLELVRRLAARTPTATVPAYAELVDLLLATPATGRGPVDQPLVFDGPRVPFGTPPVEPDRLDADDLLRVLGGALTAVLARLPLAETDARVPRWKPWRPTLSLVGAQTTADRLRDAARARGVNVNRPRSQHVVVAHPFEEQMLQRWSHRVLGGSTVRWSRMWRVAASNDKIPAGARIPALADRLVEQVGAKRVHVVVAPDAEAAAREVSALLGVELTLAERPGTGPLATDLLRRLNPFLVLALGEDGRRRLVQQHWAAVTAGEPTGRTGAPAASFDWAITAGTRMAGRLAGARYAVHGDPALLVPTWSEDVRRRIKPEDVLGFALDVLVQTWTYHRSGPTGVQ